MLAASVIGIAFNCVLFTGVIGNLKSAHIASKIEQELKELCDKYRKNDGTYDCLVPGSGGKDSVFTSHILKYKYNMNYYHPKYFSIAYLR